MDDAPVSQRPARPDDEAFLFALYTATRRAEFEAWGLADAQLGPLLEMQFAGQQGTYRAQFPHAAHYILERAGHAIGRLLVDRSAERIVLVDVTLVPEARGQGVGTHLLHRLQGEAAAAGVPLRLKVRHANPARRLYERLGFATLSDDGVYTQMQWLPPERPDRPRP